MYTPCRLILDELRAGRPVVEAVLLASKGSTPRTAGARLLAFADGRSAGSVGGGRSEAETLEAARRLAAEPEALALELHFSLVGVTDMDMICGGELSVLLHRIDPTPEVLATHARAAELEERGKAFNLLTRLEEAGSGRLRVLGRTATPALPQRPGPQSLFPTLERTTGGLTLVSPFAGARRIFLFGGGHVSLALAGLAHTLGYRVVVLEDRAEFLAGDRFPHASRLVLSDQATPTLTNALVEHEPGRSDAAVILTRGHSHDREALRAVLGFPFGYIGMIGSRSKRDAVYALLRKEGVADEALAAVHCPVGLNIGAQTPEEIAVSITAELIACRGEIG